MAYADGHHELEQVNLQVFPPTGDKPDQISADRAIYINEGPSRSGQFRGNVQIETHDALKVRTDSLVYHEESKIAETSSPVTFERENVNGRSTGALVDNEKRRLELRNDVEVTVTPDALKNAKADRERERCEAGEKVDRFARAAGGDPCAPRRV